MTAEERERYRTRIETLLGSPELGHGRGWDLSAMAEAADRLPDPIRGETLCRAAPAPAEMTRHLREAAEEVTDHEPDLAFTTEAEGMGPPHLEIWRLKAEARSDGTEEQGLYVQRNCGQGPQEANEHPWGTAMLLLEGQVAEHARDGGLRQHEPGDTMLRPAGTRYRLTVSPGDDPAVLLLATGRMSEEPESGRPAASADERWSEAPAPAGQRDRRRRESDAPKPGRAR